MARETKEALLKHLDGLLVEKSSVQDAIAETNRKLRELDRQAREALHAQVGKLADDAGLLAHDLGTLEKAFARLAETLKGDACGSTS